MMRTIFQIVITLAVVFGSVSCKTTQAQWRKQFLVSHNFHLDDSRAETYSRHYDRLSEASRDLGFSISSLRIPPNGPGMDIEDTRIADIDDWGFVITAEKGHTLDEPNTPCTVGTALFQVPANQEMPKGPSPNTALEPTPTAP